MKETRDILLLVKRTVRIKQEETFKGDRTAHMRYNSSGIRLIETSLLIEMLPSSI
jgi:hypothetical protein